MSCKIAIIGDGAMGTLCSALLAENGHNVRLFSAFPEAAQRIAAYRENRRFLPGLHLPESVHVTSRASEALADADLAVQAVPAQFVRFWWEKAGQFVPQDLPICSVAKGIENETLLRPTQIVRDLLDGSPDSDRPVAALSGPCIAPEVAQRLPATVVVAASDPALAERVQLLFSRPHFRVYTNPDLTGVETAGATKNVIAIAAGILDGLGAGDNAKAALLTRGLAEITRLGVALGASEETFAGLAGFGDLVTTCISPMGRNRSFGEAIGKGTPAAELIPAPDAVEQVVEGVATTVSVMALAARFDVQMPITRAVHGVLFAGRSPQDAIAELMARPLKSEL